MSKECSDFMKRNGLDRVFLGPSLGAALQKKITHGLKNGTFALVKNGTKKLKKSYKHCQKGSKGGGVHSIHT